MKDGHLLDCLERRGDAGKEAFYREIAAKMEEL